MSHEIDGTYDKVFSLADMPTWHGLEIPVQGEITRKTVEPVLFDIIEAPICISVPDENEGIISVPVPSHKLLAADLRKCRPDLAPELRLLPLHVPKEGYKAVTNGDLWDAMQKAIRDVDARITCVGTLGAGKKFFISIELSSGSRMTINGDSFKANLNFITSHDGTYAVECYDSMIRIVCMNTFRWSRSAKGDLNFKVYHAKNASLAIDKMGDLCNEVLKDRKEFAKAMRELNAVQMGLDTARFVTAGYFVQKNDGDIELAKRSLNAVDSIVSLFAKGKGNKGETAYDLFNGATEHWTSGEGTGKGKGTTLGARVVKSEFGSAADHKNGFADMLLDESARNEAEKLGREAIKFAFA